MSYANGIGGPQQVPNPVATPAAPEPQQPASAAKPIEAATGAVTPEILKHALGIRASQIKRFLASRNGGGDEITVLLGKVSSHDIKSIVEKLTELDGTLSVQVAERKRGEQI